MRIRILWVGKTKEGWASEGMEKYLKLVRNFAEVDLVEIKDERPGGSRGAVDKAISAEGRRIIDKATSYILLDEKGRQLSSKGLAGMIKDRARVEFVLGGPWGVSQEVRDGAVETIALSRMTLTHEMARILFLEQLYRGFTINTGRGYHH